MFSATKKVGEQKADCHASLVSFNLSRTLREHKRGMKWERDEDLEWGLNKRDRLFIIKGEDYWKTSRLEQDMPDERL